MNARRLQYVQILSVAILLATLEGCEHFRHTLGDHDAEVLKTSAETKAKEVVDVAETKAKGVVDEMGTKAKNAVSGVEAEGSKVLDVAADPKKATPLLKNSRLSGALSDEGREIERDLGIH